MIAATELRLVLVTPEKTLIDRSVRSLRFPLFDGQIGVLPGRAPLIGRLGTGELKIDGAADSERLFIDGGFVQIKGSVVTVLTNRALLISEIDAAKAEQELKAAMDLKPADDFGMANKQNAIDRARKMLSLRRGL